MVATNKPAVVTLLLALAVSALISTAPASACEHHGGEAAAGLREQQAAAVELIRLESGAATADAAARHLLSSADAAAEHGIQSSPSVEEPSFRRIPMSVSDQPAAGSLPAASASVAAWFQRWQVKQFAARKSAGSGPTKMFSSIKKTANSIELSAKVSSD